MSNSRLQRALSTSLLIHLALFGLLVLLPSPKAAPPTPQPSLVESRLVYLEIAGRSGGGGGGDRTPAPVSKLERRGDDAVAVRAMAKAELPTPALAPEPQPVAPAPPLPVVETMAGLLDRAGAMEGLGARPALSPGGGGGAGGPQGTGDGPKIGPGLGDDVVYSTGAGIDLPIRLQEVKPEYTPDAMQRKIQGVVWVEATVTADGHVRDPKVTRSLDAYGLDAQAIRAVLATPFRPGRRNGKAVAVRVAFELRFSIR